jgi:hypothetical protein
MSAQEILEELPKLDPAELESIYRRAIELHRGLALEASPELLAEIDEADESFAKDGGIELQQGNGPERSPSVASGPAQKSGQNQSSLAARWAGKFEMPTADDSDPRLGDLLERYRRYRT